MVLLFESPPFCWVSEEQRQKFTQLTEILMHGVTFSIPNCAEFNSAFTTCLTFVLFPSVNYVEPSVSIVHFPAIKALEEEKYIEENLSSSSFTHYDSR